jgi:hypothetical protein
LSLLHTDNSAQ